MQCCLLVLPKSGHAPLIDSLVHNGVKGLLSSFHKFKVRFISTAYCSLDDNCKFIQRSRGDCRNVAKKDALDTQFTEIYMHQHYFLHCKRLMNYLSVIIWLMFKLMPNFSIQNYR